MQSSPSPQSPDTRSMLERELPMLAGIGAFVTWCEDLLAVLSGPILTAGLAIALVDLLSDGQLFARLPMLLWVWAGSMALGLDAQFIGSAAKLARAIRQRKGWVIFGYIVLCTSLGYVAFLATYVFAVQEANGISTADALARLGMDSTTWIFQRSILAVVLVFLSGFLRYVAPAVNAAAEAQTERERLEREIDLAPLRAQLQAAKLRQVRSGVTTLLGREAQDQQSSARTPAAPATALASIQPEPQATIHHQYHAPIPTYKAMHDRSDEEILDEYADEIADEIADEVEDDSDLFSTMKIPAVSARSLVESQPATNDTKQRTPRALESSAKRGNSDRSKSLRKANADLRAEAKKLRRGRIRDAAYAVLDEWYASGQSERLSDKELTRRVQARVDFDVNPSGNTVARWRGPWQSSRAHKASMEREQQNSQPIIDEDIVEMLAREEALV